MTREFVIVSIVLVLAAGTCTTVAQTSAYHPRGVRSYLVNYNAIGGDRYLAEFAARRFVLLDEAGSRDIPLVRAVNPDIPILRYKDIVALHGWMNEFDTLNVDENAFLHSSEPSGLQVQRNGDTLALSWLSDRRALDLRGYRLYWMHDSLSAPVRLLDSVLTQREIILRQPKSAVFLLVTSVLDGESEINYGLPVRIHSATAPLQLHPMQVHQSRTTEEVEVDLLFREVKGARIDSVFIVADWDRNNQLSIATERSPLAKNGDSWGITRSVDISGLRTYCGYEFVLQVWSDGAMRQLPRRGTWHTNINNRLINNTYGFYVMNVGSSAWRRAFINEVLLAFSQRGYSGLFEDDCWYRVANYGVDSWPPEPYDDHVWRADLYEMLDSIRIGIAPRPAYFNGLHSEISDSLLLHTEGGMTEGFAYTHWSGLQRGSAWRNQCNRGLSATRKHGKTWMALGGAPYDDIPGRLYTLASYLLVADSLSMYANATDYQEFAHFPEFDIPLGAALTHAVADVDELARDVGGGRLHVREFQRGSVVINAGNTAAVYPDANGRPVVIASGGVSVEGGFLFTTHMSDTLQPGSVRIYVDAPPGEALRSPVIDSIRVTPPVVPSDGSTPCGISVLAHDPSPAVFRSDSLLPLHIVVDAGELGGPRNLVLSPTSQDAHRRPAWYEGSFSIPVGAPADSALVPITVYATTGLVTVGHTMLRINRGDSTNLVANYSFEIDNNDDGVPDFWHSYVKGFDYDTTGGHAVSGTRSIHVRNDSLTDFRGVSMRVDVGQTVPQKLELSGWSKCTDVSGEPNNDYSLYADIRYTDGTSLYGRTARFSTATHDWEYSSTVIEPEKPIDYISLYALFRRHTGEAWFDHLALRPWQEPSSAATTRPSEFAVSIFPNPARDQVQIRFQLDRASTVSVRCHDVLGRLRRNVPSRMYAVGKAVMTLSLSGLEAGMYFLRVETASGGVVQPVIKR